MTNGNEQDVKNLWGDLDSIEQLRSPIAILRTQAAYLDSYYKGELQGNISRSPGSTGSMKLIFYIVVPALNNFSFKLFTVDHPLNFYPLKIDSPLFDVIYECESEQDFLGTLEEILSSTEVHRALASLYAQTES